MTVAALQAQTLQRCLQAGHHDPAPRFFRAAARAPWSRPAAEVRSRRGDSVAVVGGRRLPASELVGDEALDVLASSLAGEEPDGVGVGLDGPGLLFSASRVRRKLRLRARRYPRGNGPPTGAGCASGMFPVGCPSVPARDRSRPFVNGTVVVRPMSRTHRSTPLIVSIGLLPPRLAGQRPVS